MKHPFLLLFVACFTFINVSAQVKQDTTYIYQLQIDQVGVAAHNPKQHFGLKQEPISSSVVGMRDIEREKILSVKDLSAIMPNFYQPDYGSKMTSSI